MAVPEKGGFRTEKKVTEGPVSCISTATLNQLQVDDETRHLSIWTDESEEQTARILKASFTDLKRVFGYLHSGRTIGAANRQGLSGLHLSENQR